MKDAISKVKLCREELCGLGVHLFLRTFERDNAKDDEPGKDGDFEDDP